MKGVLRTLALIDGLLALTAPLLSAQESAAPAPSGVVELSKAREALLELDLETAWSAYWTGCQDPSPQVLAAYWGHIDILATEAERSAWSNLAASPESNTAACAFLYGFWTERAMRAGLTMPERMAQHEKRLQYAHRAYRRPRTVECTGQTVELGTLTNRIGGCHPVLDDRGVVYVRMGGPDRVATFAGFVEYVYISPSCYAPNESWAYDSPNGTRVFHFSAGTGGWGFQLVDNLSSVYICGSPDAVRTVQPLIKDAQQFVNAGERKRCTVTSGELSPGMGGGRPSIERIAYLVLPDLYLSRQALDPWYASMAFRFRIPMPDTLCWYLDQIDVRTGEVFDSQRELASERHATWRHAYFVIDSVPDQPESALNANLLVEVLQFGADEETTRLWFNGVVEGEPYTAVTDSAGLHRYEVYAFLGMIGPDGAYRTVGQNSVLTVDHELGDGESIPFRIPAEAGPGLLRYNISVRDAGQRKPGLATGNYSTDSIVVRTMIGELPELSDVVVAPDSGGTWTVAGEVFLRPSPRHNTGADGIAHVYLEAYGLTPRAPYTAAFRLEPEDGDQPFEIRFEGQAGAGAVNSMYFRLNLSDSEPGFYRMTVTVKDSEREIESLPHHTNIYVDPPSG